MTKKAEEENKWNVMHSRYSPDRSFEAKCHGQKENLNRVKSTTTSTFTTTVTDHQEESTTVMTPITSEESTDRSIVRARLVMPNISLKSASSHRTDQDLIEEPEKQEQHVWDNNWEVTYEYEYIDEGTERDSVVLPEITENNLADNKVTNGKLESINESDIIPPTQKPQPIAAELCCGEYSDHRFPYYTKNRGCCGGQTFDKTRKQCCNGTIRDKSAICL